MKTKLSRTKRKVSATVTFAGDGTIKKIGHLAFAGGVPAPKLTKNQLTFSVHREYLGRNGLWNPRDSEGPVKAGFQINFLGTSQGYRKLAGYFLSLAELDSRLDEDFHQHLEGIVSENGNTRLHLIFRKNDKRKKR